MSQEDATKPPAAPPKSPPLGRNLSFHLLWSSTFASGMGDRLAWLAGLGMLGYASQGVDNSSIQSGLDFFFFLPYLLWSPLAGWLADRVPRKWLMFVADEARGVFVLIGYALIPFVADGQLAPGDRWMVWLLMAAIGLMAATFVPAKLSIIPNVVGYSSLQRANAVVVLMGIIGNLMGFGIGGLLVGQSIEAVIFLSAVCYCVSGLFWVFLKTPWQSPADRSIEAAQRIVTDITDGFHYAWHHHPIKALIFAAALIWTGTSIYMPALAVINVEMYQGDAASFSQVMLALGAGMLVGSILMGLLNTRLGSEWLITLGLFGAGLFIGLQMIVPSFALGLLIAASTGFFASVLLVPINTLLQRATADHIRGRVFSAKEILVEFGKVVIAGAIWKIPHTDPYMQPLAILLSLFLITVALWGAVRYILTGPMPSRSLNALWRAIRIWAQGVHRLEIRGRHHVPHTGPVLLVSNHTAGVDPLLIQAALPRLARWMMAEEYMFTPLKPLWKRMQPIGVRRGQRDAGAAREAIDALRQGNVVAIFPEGGINRSPGRTLQPLDPGVGVIAKRAGAPIVPIHITGTPKTHRTLLSFLLPSRSHVTFGPPFTLPPTKDRTQSLTTIRNHLQQLQHPSPV